MVLPVASSLFTENLTPVDIAPHTIAASLLAGTDQISPSTFASSTIRCVLL